MTTVAYIIDPIDTLNPKKDSTIELLREATRRGWKHRITTPHSITFDGHQLTAQWLTIELQEGTPWYRVVDQQRGSFEGIDVVLMRKDPPFDNEYLYATQLLDRLPDAIRVMNAPSALRDHNEKLALLEFIDLAPPTLVTASKTDIHQWIDEKQDVILKPLDSMGGQGIFRVRQDDPNRFMIVDTVTGDGKHHIMAQAYLPEIAQGDKRLLIIGGKPIDFTLARMPAKGESRANLAAGGTGIAQPITEYERQIGERVGRQLIDRGLFLIGVDIIGDFVTEINVTSPTCFVEIRQQTGFNVAQCFWDRFTALP